jgi:heme-degrading monooxygenase HmoA
MAEVLEVTTFKLAGRSGAEFVTANADINDYLKRQPGFRWRKLALHDDDTIIDIVAWDTMADAEAGANGIVSEMKHSPVHNMIDHGTVDWRLVTVLMQIG